MMAVVVISSHRRGQKRSLVVDQRHDLAPQSLVALRPTYGSQPQPTVIGIPTHLYLHQIELPDVLIVKDFGLHPAHANQLATVRPCSPKAARVITHIIVGLQFPP